MSDQPGSSAGNPLMQHASAVALGGRAVVISGAAGTGKSALALQLMALGCVLVADDQCALWREGAGLRVAAPGTIRGQIEARFVGILNAYSCPQAQVALWVDMDQVETQRLPPKHVKKVLGVSCPLVHNVQAQHFSAAILQLLKAGRSA